MDKEETKTIVKEAIQEWLQEQFAVFGRWSFMGIAAMLFAGIVYLFFISDGWIPPLHK